MYGKLVHRPSFGHHCHAPRPPFGEPREVGERYLGHPELTDYWIKPYLLEALKHYPRLDDACVVQGLWKFANTICLQNKHTSIRTPPTYDDPVTTHKIAFLDKDDIELGCIKFWRKVDSTFGIDMILNGRGISITGNNDDPTLCLVDTPIGDNKKQIVNIEYLEFSLSALQGLVDGLTDRIEALEDYKGQADSLIKDPNGNFRTVHTAIHNDSDDQNIPTCYAVYQFGEAIRNAIPVVENAVQSGSSNVPSQAAVYNFVTSAISNGINGISLPIASTSQKGIMQVGDYLSVSNGVVSVDVNALSQSVGGSGSSGGVVDVGVFGSTILGGFVGSSSMTPGIYTSTVGTEYDASDLYQALGGHNGSGGVFSTYPAGTKFECIVASYAKKESAGDDNYTNITNGAFKLKSLGVGGGAIRYLLHNSAPTVGSTVTSDGDRYITDAYTVWLEDVNVIGRNASTDNIQVAVRGGYVLPANTSYVVDSILATYEHPAEGGSNSPGWAGGLCYKCVVHTPS